MYLLTNPNTNNAGVYLLRTETIVLDCKIKDADQPLELLCQLNEVICEGDYKIILRHPSFQKWEKSTSIAQAIVSDIESAPPEIIKILRDSDYEYPPIKSDKSFKEEKNRLKDAFDLREQKKKEKQSKRDNYRGEKFEDVVPF